MKQDLMPQYVIVLVGIMTSEVLVHGKLKSKYTFTIFFYILKNILSNYL